MDTSTKRQLKPEAKMVLISMYVAVAIIAPQLTLLWRPIVGVYVTAAALVALIALAVRSGQSRNMAIAAAILPVTLLVSISLPQPDIYAQMGVYYSVILLLTILCNYTFVFDVAPNLSKFSKKLLLTLLLMVVIGGMLGLGGYGVLRHATYPFYGVPLYLVAIAVVIFAVAEEQLFRGLIQQQAAKALHPLMAAVLTVILYTTIYVGHGAILSTLFALVAGAVLSGIYYFKQNLILTTTANALMKLTYVGLMTAFVLR